MIINLIAFFAGLLFGLPGTINAQINTYGDLRYGEIAGEITIIGFINHEDSDWITSVIIPDSIDGKPIVAISNSAFDHRTSLQKVTLPNSLRSIGYSAFEGTGITEIIIPEGVTKIESYTFRGCDSLKYVKLPNTLISIEEWAFGESGIENIVFPANLKSIGEYAFSQNHKLMTCEFNCIALEKIGTGNFEHSAPKFFFNRGVGVASLSASEGLGPYNLNDKFAAPYIFYYDGAPGFQWPGWNGCKIQPINQEIEIQESEEFLTTKSSKIVFGTNLIKSKTASKKFTIHNVGAKDLKKIRVSIAGKHRKEFKVSRIPSRILIPQKTMDLVVRFVPTKKGKRSAVLIVKSNDENESSFKIGLSGTGWK